MADGYLREEARYDSPWSLGTTATQAAIFSVTRIDETHVRVDFASPILNNRAIRSTEIYEIRQSDAAEGEDELTVIGVELGPGTTSIQYLILEHAEERTDDFTVLIHYPEIA